MKKIYYSLLAATILIVCASYNSEWGSEQCVQMISSETPIDAQGVTPIYIRYKPEGKATCRLPSIVSGSTMNSRDLSMHVGLDLSTLDALNVEHFGNRKRLSFKPLENKHYEFPGTVQISVGEHTDLLPIDFALKDLDQVDKWVLLLATQSNDPSHSYQVDPRRFYRGAVLHTSPFNDYSGQYSAIACKMYLKGDEEEAIVPGYHTSYVIDDRTIFLYAGLIDIDRLNRKYYRTKFELTEKKIGLQARKLKISSDSGDMNLVARGQPSYTVEEEMDATRPYPEHIYVTTSNLEYEFTDYTLIPGYPLKYVVKRSLTTERKVNTQIPDKDRAAEW